MSFPVYFNVGPLRLHPHFVLELVAYALGLYLALFRRLQACCSESNFLPSALPSFASLFYRLLFRRFYRLSERLFRSAR